MNAQPQNGDKSDPEPSGGGGAVAKREELKLERRALRQRWNVSEQELRAVLSRQIEIAIDPDTKNRTATSASRAVIAAVAQNQADEHKQQPDEVNINLTGGVRIVEDDNWYGNADRLAALADGASDSDSIGPGPV